MQRCSNDVGSVENDVAKLVVYIFRVPVHFLGIKSA